MNDGLAGQITTLTALLAEHNAKEEEFKKLAAEQARLADLIAREDLPQLLMQAEIEEMTLTDGTKVKLMQAVQASISADNRAAAHKWLVEHNFGGLIKTNVSVAFEAAQHDEADALGERLVKEYGGAVEVDASVHPSTLKAFVRERIEAGDELPMDLFGVFTYTEAKITKSRRR